MIEILTSEGIIMRKNFKNEKGAIAIEAIIALTLFMTSVLAIMFISLVVRVQSNMQYALQQTAKEISGYYYMFDKLGLASLSSVSGNDKTQAGMKKVNGEIGHIVDFAQATEESINDATSVNLADGVSVEELDNLISNGCNDATVLKEKADAIVADVEALTSEEGNASGQIQAILTVFGKSMISKSISKFIAPFVCRTIMPKYLAGSTSAANDMLESVGIENGVKGLDFTQSELLRDGRSIKLVVVYELDMEKMTLGVVKGKARFRQVASTAAWVNGQASDEDSIKSIWEVADWEE